MQKRRADVGTGWIGLRCSQVSRRWSKRCREIKWGPWEGHCSVHCTREERSKQWVRGGREKY